MYLAAPPKIFDPKEAFHKKPKLSSTKNYKRN